MWLSVTKPHFLGSLDAPKKAIERGLKRASNFSFNSDAERFKAISFPLIYCQAILFLGGTVLPDALLQFPDQGGTNLAGIGNNRHVGHFHHRRFGILVDGNDEFGPVNGSRMLNGATDAE